MIKFNDASETRYNEYNIVGFYIDYVDSRYEIILLGANTDKCELVYEDEKTIDKDIKLLDKVLHTTSMKEVISRRDKEVECF